MAARRGLRSIRGIPTLLRDLQQSSNRIDKQCRPFVFDIFADGGSAGRGLATRETASPSFGLPLQASVEFKRLLSYHRDKGGVLHTDLDREEAAVG